MLKEPWKELLRILAEEEMRGSCSVTSFDYEVVELGGPMFGGRGGGSPAGGPVPGA